jgi:hypothetical protein
MEDIMVLLISGVPIAVAVFLVVQGLKVFGFVDGGSAPKAAIGAGAFFGLSWMAGELFPVAKPFIEIGYVTILGSLTAGLFYEYIAAPILEKLGVNLRSE